MSKQTCLLLFCCKGCLQITAELCQLRDVQFSRGLYKKEWFPRCIAAHMYTYNSTLLDYRSHVGEKCLKVRIFHSPGL